MWGFWGGLEGMGAVLEGFKGVWGVLWGAGRDPRGAWGRGWKECGGF